MSVATPLVKLSRNDFKTEQEVRWCPGCGDYAILAQFQKVFPTLGIPREQFAVISGIGCSSRFPYYMNTYGFHTIHGRAPAVATGLKIMNPELSVWVITGDGDGLSIGGNHLIHAMRRNIDLNIVLFNNQIYGLTKGQYSPTSEFGKRTKSTPYGSVDTPFMPLSVALGAEASFIARAADREQKLLGDILTEAAKHKGTSFVEIYQNCPIFNDGAFFNITEKGTKDDNQLVVEHGKPLVFNKGKQGVIFDCYNPRVVNVDEVGLEAITIHREDGPLGYHLALARMHGPELPTALGVIRRVERPSYDELVNAQVETEIDKKGRGDLRELLQSGHRWTVEG
ncbi:MAG: 2-oxoacid:ferredoxin oxidoreductase subunit beta [Deltaproteobacteria bacterium]|nr:MAG: 2-oxoacid:ferredoxin oxidoreductase subunit beta [Deltaproteobacteria bacterium]